MKRSAFSLCPCRGRVLWLEKHNCFLPLPLQSFLRQAVRKYIFFNLSPSPVFIFARAKQGNVPSAANSRRRKRKRSQCLQRKKKEISFTSVRAPVSQHPEEVDNNGALCLFKYKHVCKQTSPIKDECTNTFCFFFFLMSGETAGCFILNQDRFQRLQLRIILSTPM